MAAAHIKHQCPECGDWELCLAPHKCREAGTTEANVLCEDCARAKVAKSCEGAVR
jgi:hypothetical protein